MYRYKKKKGKKKREAETSLNSLARNARTFRKLSLSVRRIFSSPFALQNYSPICCPIRTGVSRPLFVASYNSSGKVAASFLSINTIVEPP